MAEHDGVEDDRTLAIPELQDAQLGRLVRHLADAVVIADAMGTIVFWNTAAQAMFGWSAGEAVGRSLDLIIPERLRKRHWDGYVQVWSRVIRSTGTGCLRFLLSTVTVVRSRLRSRSRCSWSMIRRGRSVSLR